MVLPVPGLSAMNAPFKNFVEDLFSQNAAPHTWDPKGLVFFDPQYYLESKEERNILRVFLRFEIS